MGSACGKEEGGVESKNVASQTLVWVKIRVQTLRLERMPVKVLLCSCFEPKSFEYELKQSSFSGWRIKLV